MNIPYGFDCYSFLKNEIRYFEPNVTQVRQSILKAPLKHPLAGNRFAIDKMEHPEDYVMFTRKNEDYTREQLEALMQAGRLDLNSTEGRKIFCGIKIQIGISVVTNFLQKGLQYKPPIRGRSEFINGSWTGIVSGLTVDRNTDKSYDIAFGNFLAYDEEFPYLKFGPFFAIESKLVMLTGSSRQIEASTFGTNLDGQVWLTVGLFMIVLSLLAGSRVHWEQTKVQTIQSAIKEHVSQTSKRKIDSEVIKFTANLRPQVSADTWKPPEQPTASVWNLVQNFLFIYYTMLLNKPSLEFDDLIWPKHTATHHLMHSKQSRLPLTPTRIMNLGHRSSSEIYMLLSDNEKLQHDYKRMMDRKRRRKYLPTSIRVLSYLWSAACLVMVSIYSGELLAVILLHADQNIDTISQLINSKPPIEPVIRQDDFTYNLMLKSLDENMLILHNKTKIIPRTEVYTRRFIESVSNRKQALLGDDELIETIYDIYHKYYPLYKSKMSYLQYPISIMYRREFNATLERKLRRGIVQVFETGLIQRWYQAQKDTYIQFYDTYEKKDNETVKNSMPVSSDQKYKPLSMHHFESFLRLVLFCKLLACVVLLLEVVHFRLTRPEYWPQYRAVWRKL